MTKNTTTTTTKATPTATFKDLLREFERALANREPHNPDRDPYAIETEREHSYRTALYNLSTALARSVLKKCIDPTRKMTNRVGNSYDPHLARIQRMISGDIHKLIETAYTSDESTKYEFNADGELEREITDRDTYDALTVLARTPLEDGLDLVQTAVLALSEYADKYANEAEWTETAVEVTRLKRRVYLGDDKPVAGDYETVSITPVQLAFRDVRKQIERNKSLNVDPRNGYSYIAIEVDNPTNDTIDTIYWRQGKFADIGGAVRSVGDMGIHSSLDGIYTADEYTRDRTDNIIRALHLTAREHAILMYRTQGRGNKYIAKRLGISENACKGATHRIRSKALRLALTPDVRSIYDALVNLEEREENEDA